MSKLTTESTSVQSYLTILQGVINRMATNSASCKTWCMTLVSAILVLVADKLESDYAFISLIPVILFLFLDSYYLALEKKFRELYNSFIKKLHSGNATVEDVFIVSPNKEIISNVFTALLSVSIWPFYSILGAMVYLTINYLR